MRADGREEIDPHDSKNWLSHDAAINRANVDPSLKLGVVLSDADPYFLLDLDDCEVGGQWNNGAMSIVQMFAGAAIEVSVNGRGLHIMGQCDASALTDRKHKFLLHGVQCEWYATKRFVALGHGFTGEINYDWTQHLAAVLPVKPPVESLALIDQADPEWVGPDDDDQLINLMMSARGSAASVFEGRAKPADLWNANVEVLSRTYPSPSGDAFDRSSADGALMAHLAFWTGKNTERMDRLFRRSALMREKYARRPDYVASTISGAVASTRNVYKQTLKATQKQVVAMDAQTVADVTDRSKFGEILTPEEQIEYFAGCAYIAHDHRILTPNGVLLKPGQFNAVYGGHMFLMSSDGSRPAFEAFKAFTENRVVRFPVFARTRFKPDQPFGATIDGDGVNIYSPAVVESIAGDVSPALGLLEKLLPEERDRLIFLSWCAALIQNPGKKLLWSPVLQGVMGNGKSIWPDMLISCVGEKYCYTPKAAKIDAQFNAFLSRRLLINVEEMSLFGRRETMETIKDYITAHRQEVEQKGVDSQMDTDYCANWIFCTNHKNAIIKDRNDRRFAMFFTNQQSREDMVRDGMLTDDYFPKIWRWLREEKGYAKIRSYLENYPIVSEFNPAGRCTIAPATSSTTEAIVESLGLAEQYIFDAVEAGVTGFRGGWISATRVGDVLHEAGLKRGPRQIGSMLEGMGYVARGRAARPILHEGNVRPRLYSDRGVEGDQYDYERAQGYIA